MTLEQACAALASVKGANPNAQLYGEDLAGGMKYAIALDGSSPGGGWTLQSCTP